MADDLPPLEKWREIGEANLDLYDDWMRKHGDMVTSRAYWKGRAKAAGDEIERLRAELAEAKAAIAAAVEAERERCAIIATHHDLSPQRSTAADARARAIAAAIRGGDTR